MNLMVAIQMIYPNLVSVDGPKLFAQIQSMTFLNLLSELSSLKIGLRGQTFELRPIAVNSDFNFKGLNTLFLQKGPRL